MFSCWAIISTLSDASIYLPSWLTCEPQPTATVPVVPTTITPTLTLDEQAEKTVRNYFKFITEKQFDEAYDLLDPYLQKHTDFIRPKWDDYMSTTTLVILNDDISISSNGDRYKANFVLDITPSGGTKRPGDRTFCVIHNPQEENWFIKSINDKFINCW